ncbi:hypothetical protein KEM52_005441 [Ascosphaera acerosa]|nr:hypothetical protein KEM52_005441 [Ascosphaera acerosa]
MRFFSVISAFMITAAVAAPMPGPAPVEVAARDIDAAAAVQAIVDKVKTIDFSQFKTELEKRDILKRADSQNIQDVVTNVESLVKNVVGKFQSDVGSVSSLVNDVKKATSSSGGLLSNGINVINGAATLLGGNAPKYGNQLLTSKLVNDLGKQSTYDTLLPLLKNAKPLLDAKFVNNVAGLINGIAPIVSGVAELIKFLESIL